MVLGLQSRLAQVVRTAAREAFNVDLEAIAFQYPPQIELGDLALTAPFDLAKALRRKPRDIAERLAAALSPAPGVRGAEVARGDTGHAGPTPRTLGCALPAAVRVPPHDATRPGPERAEPNTLKPHP